MGVRLLLLNVFYQTVITASLGGVVLPFSDSIGIVTPIKPKPLPASTVSPSITPICDSEDLKLIPSSAKGPISRKFSSPIAITSSSRALPVPKINSTSIENVKMPKNLRAKFLAQIKSPVTSTKPNICPPEISLPNKYLFSLSPSQLSNTLSPHSPLEIHKLTPIPIISSLPDIPVESLKTSGINLLRSSSNTSQFSPLGEVILPFTDTIGKVTPIKPKPVPTCTIPSSITLSTSPVCESKDNPKLFPPATKGPISREFLSPLVFTSTSRALPVPKINSTSIENVKIPENLRELFLAQNKSSGRSTKLDICSPEVSFPNKYPFSSSPSKLSNILSPYSPLEIHKLYPISSISSLRDIPVESSKTSGINLLSSSSNTGQFSPQCGVTHPFFDSVGKVIPIKPKPLPTSSVPSSIISSMSPVCDDKNNLKLFPSAAKGPISREFSTPLVLTSTSRALPVPKIDSTSIKNVKMPKNLREKFLVQNKTSTPDICPPKVFMPNKYPFSSSPSKVHNTLSSYSPLEIHKISPLPSISSLPDLAVESLETKGIDLLSSSSKTSQFCPQGGVTLSFFDTIGKVIPIKPKPLPTSTVSSSITSSSPPICHSKNNPIFFSPAAKEPMSREFSSPIAITSFSRALPVPKIDSASIENVKMSQRLRERFLALNEGPVRNAKSEASLAKKFPFLPPPSNPLEINKLSPLPCIKSLTDVPVESRKSSGIDLLSSSTKTGQFSAPISVTLLPRSRICEPPSTLEAKKSTFSEHLTENTISPLSSSLLSLKPLHYNSRYLPEVKNPCEPLSYRPFYNKGADNVDLPSYSCSYNILSPPTLSSGDSPNLHLYINEPHVLSYLDSIKTLQIQKPIIPIQLPKTPINIHISSNNETSAQNAVTKNLCSPKEVNAASVPVAFESNLESKSALSTVSLRNDQNLQDDRTSDFKLKSCSPSSPSHYFNSPQMPITISSPNVDVMLNKMSRYDCTKSITPDLLPLPEKMYQNNLGNYQTSPDSKNVPSLEIINLPRPKPLKYSPPKIPNEPIPIIFSDKTFLSPLAYCPTAITQASTTPISYINQSSTSSISETTSNMVSSITNLLSNITQNILSSYKPLSILQNNPQTPTYTIQPNPYTGTLLKPEQLSPVLTIPQCNPVNNISFLPVINAPIDSKKAQTSDPSTTESLNPPLAFKVSPSPPLFISSPQITAPVLPPTSLITYSSPPFCPSHLPSPILPSNPAIASPFHMEAPVYQSSSSKKDSDVENIIDLVLLTEILNNDESFDWDDLDTLLAFLSLS